MALAYNFGFRRAELLNMKRRQVDLLDRIIRLEPGTTKNDDGRIVEMTEDVYRLLGECVRGKGPDDFVFTRANGKPIRDFRGTWEMLCKDAGAEGLLLHDFRRSAVRNVVRLHVPEKVAMAITGHKTRSPFDRYKYNIVSEFDVEDAAHKIDERRFGA